PRWEVAWPPAWGPWAVPAMAMAPPKSSSFSVSVVLPASGCEMIAKVRRRRISASSSVMSSRVGSGVGVVTQCTLENGGILAAIGRLIVAASHAHLLEAERQVQADRRGVRGPHLEKRIRHAGSRGALDERAEQSAADSVAAIHLADTQIENVGFAGAEAHDAVRHDLAGHRENAAHVADPEAVAEDPLAPWKLVRGTLDHHHVGDIAAAHGADHDLGGKQLRSGGHRRRLASIADTRCGQT